MRDSRVISEEPEPRQLEQMLAELPEPRPEEVEALRRDFELGESVLPTSESIEWPLPLQEAAGKVDVRYAGPPTSDRPLVGPALVFAKRLFRLIGQPFINEALRKQVEFNQAILLAVGQIHDTLQQHARSQALWRAEVDTRLRRLEEGREAPPPEAPSARPGPEPSGPPPGRPAKAPKRARKPRA